MSRACPSDPTPSGEQAAGGTAEERSQHTPTDGDADVLERIFDDVHLLIAYLDPAFNFIRVNRAYATVEGKEPSWFVGKNHFDLYPHGQNPAVFAQVVRTGRPYFAYDRAFTYAGNPERGTSWWDWSLQAVKEPNGRVGGLILSLLDVTERHRAQERRHAAEGRYRQVVELAAEGIIVTDVGCRIAEANPAMYRLLGAPPGTLVGKPLAHFVAQAETQLCSRLWALVENAPTPAMTFDLRRMDGRTVTVEANVRQLPDRTLLIVCRDVTARRHREETLRLHRDRLKRMTAQLSRAEEEQRRLLAIDLHDQIAQSLAACRLSLGLLQDAIDQPETSEGVRRIRQQLEQTLHDARTLTFQLSPPILYELGLQAALEWLAEEFFAHHGLSVAVSDGTEIPELDEPTRVMVYRMVRELLENVVRHARATEAEVRLSGSADELLVRVEDNGVGFNVTSLDSVDAEEHVGLLHIRERLENAGGRMELESSRNEGTRVTLFLPLGPDNLAEGTES